MAKNLARNLVYYAELLKEHPLLPGTGALEAIHPHQPAVA
jgi:hypothetical protein